MTTIIAVVSFVGVVVGIVAGVLAIRRHYDPEAKPHIVNPPHQSENGGRYLTISAIVPYPRRRAFYWIAIQPNDCRADGKWWPQNSPIELNSSGFGSVPGVRLGREGPDASEDIGKTFTVGLFEVTKNAQRIFVSSAKDDQR